MNFSNPDSILKILLSPDMDYNEIIDAAQNLLPNIETPHTNSLGNKYPSALSQCILECFKIKNNFTSSMWFNAQKIDTELIKPNAEPVSFSRRIANNETVDYEVYNADQINMQNYSPPQKTVKNKKEHKEVNVEELKRAVLNFVYDFNGLYGRSGISKILKGSASIKDNDFNAPAVNSEFFGHYKDVTVKFITSIVDELISENLLFLTKADFGRPLVNINRDIKIDEIEFKVDETENSEIDDENFAKITELVETGANIFITGHAGTGKSFILSKLKQKYPKLVVTSTTGIAAVNVKGQTLHSWAGVGICNRPIAQTVERILTKPAIKNQITRCRMLAIDEISMLDIKTFEYVDSVLREIRGGEKPFGGIQVIFLGDFYQLPPVNNPDEEEFRKYCFESKLWQDLNLQTVILTKNYRQSEENLIKALSHMRENSLTTADIELLQSRECPETDKLSDILHIFATNFEADRYNNLKFNSINSPEYALTAEDEIYKNGAPVKTPSNEREANMFKRIDTVCTAEKIIYLKVGVRVMLLTNLDFERGLINGSCGVVEEIGADYINVEFDNGICTKIERHNFEFYNNEILTAVRKQFPLRLAYGITIHKSQGMSLDRLVVDCSRIFEKGQVYVALSRIKTLEGLYLHSFNPYKVMVDEKVARFYANL